MKHILLAACLVVFAGCLAPASTDNNKNNDADAGGDGGANNGNNGTENIQCPMECDEPLICDETTGLCGQCSRDDQCIGALKCVDADAGPTCGCVEDSDCTDAGAPFCLDNVCVACRSSEDCPDHRPVCAEPWDLEPKGGPRCAECDDENLCADGKLCVDFGVGGECHPCGALASCDDPTLPVCDEGTCATCSEDDHCGRIAGRPHCATDEPLGCHECVFDEDCPDDQSCTIDGNTRSCQ